MREIINLTGCNLTDIKQNLTKHDVSVDLRVDFLKKKTIVFKNDGKLNNVWKVKELINSMYFVVTFEIFGA